MCTVTYLPSANNLFILTHNRDEHIERAIALPPIHNNWGGVDVYAPIDGKAKGTWIACSKDGFALCLLNGGFEKHMPKSSYAKSRGLVIPDYFKYKNIKQYVTFQNWIDFEPFTLIIIEPNTKANNVYELVWTGESIYLKELDNTKPFIWSSSTLYTTAMVEQRKAWFNTWQKENKIYTPENIFSFHNFNPSGTEGFIIERPNGRKTVSITQIHNENGTCNMQYTNLLTPIINAV